MTSITAEELQRDLSGYLRRIEAGETLIITRAEEPIAEFKPLGSAQREPRPYGLAEGDFVTPDDFDAPLPDALLDSFES